MYEYRFAYSDEICSLFIGSTQLQKRIADLVRELAQAKETIVAMNAKIQTSKRPLAICAITPNFKTSRLLP
jgi:hypothetical protein